MATALENTGPRSRKEGVLERSRGNAVWAWLTPIIWLTVIGGLSFGGWTLFQRSGEAEANKAAATALGKPGTLTHTVAKSRLLVTIVDDGNVESARNIDVKCQVAGGAAILWIVPDGKEVVEGELLVKLDQSSIEDQLNTQKIALGKSEASKIQAHENFEAAEIAVQEYDEGTFVKELQISEANINIAQENLRSSENLLEHTRKMSRKGFATALQVEADEFAVERSKLELESAKTSKRVLQDFTRKKMLKELEAKREASAALKGSELAAFNLEQARRDRLEKQLGNCQIKAPQNGMVIYANDASSRYSSSSGPKIEEGAMVRESQTILRLPDLSNMQVKVTVHESKVERLRMGMPASIRISGKEFRGKVATIANQPEAASFFGASIKEYATIVKIDGEAEGLKPGMTAEVEVLVADLSDVLAVPVSCTKELGNKTYVWVAGTSKHEQREVVTGQTNDKMIEIREGLKEGDVVMLNIKELYDEAIKEEAKKMPEVIDAKSKFGDAALQVDPNAPKSGGDRKVAGPSGGTDGAAPAPGRGGPGGGGFKLTVPEIMKQDKDGDGKITQEEANEQLKRRWSENDTNGDNVIDRDEAKAMVERISKRMKEMQQNGGGGPPAAPGG